MHGRRLLRTAASGVFCRSSQAPIRSKRWLNSFLDTWQFAATDPERVKHQHGFIELLRDGKATLPDLIDASERRCKELDQPKPPGFFLYVDQGEELYVRAEEHQRRRFSELLAQALPDQRLRAMMSMRSDFLGHLQNDTPLFKIRQQIDVPPLGEEQLREIISRPAQLLGVRFETESLVEIITRRTAEDSVRDVGALPLLSYTLDDMWTQMVRQDDGTLRLPAQSFELGGVLVDRADKFLATHSSAEDALRRVLTLRLATVRDDGEPTRRRAVLAEFSDEEWRLVSELADYPNRLLVIVTTEAGDTYAEVAHETIFRRWAKLREWIDAEREFLAWRSRLEAACRAWQATPDASKSDALLMGHALAQAQSWHAKRGEDIPAVDRAFILQSRKTAQRRKLRVQALVGVLVAVMVAGVAAWWDQDWLKERLYPLVNVRALTRAQESALNPKDAFKECTDCPEMVVVPAGTFVMGSRNTETLADSDEFPQHPVSITEPFAVSKFEVTFENWDTCYELHGCRIRPDDYGWGRANRPVIGVDWDDAEQYVSWLSKQTGKGYRLLSEAEWEYAARAGTTTAYSWGDEVKKDGKAMADCFNCGSPWDDKETAPVGLFAPNAFGLHDMLGNVWEWVEDCYHASYDGAPKNGSAWTDGDCKERVSRGGSWGDLPQVLLRSAFRLRSPTVTRYEGLGFRVGRTLGVRPLVQQSTPAGQSPQTAAQSPQTTGHRVALVIGNSAYQNAPALSHPQIDAQAMAVMFQKAGFDVVSTLYDAGNLQFKRAIAQFEDEADHSDIAVVYYSGYGIDIQGVNYLIPVDAKIAPDRDAADEAITLQRLAKSIDGANRLRLVILDASRDNPFAQAIKQQQQTAAAQGANRGLTESTSKAGTLFAYAAIAGSEAEDGDAEHSTYTNALLHNLFVPALDIRLAFGRILVEVQKKTSYRQTPFVYGSLEGGNISLVPALPDRPGIDLVSEKIDYSVVKQIGMARAWEVFLVQHTTGFYSSVARQQLRLEELQYPPSHGNGP